MGDKNKKDEEKLRIDDEMIAKAGAVIQLVLAVAFLIVSFKNEAKGKKKKSKKKK